MKAKIKAWLRKWLEEDNYAPKFSRELKACSFESKNPVGNGKYHEYLFQCTEWSNAEGMDFSINWRYGDNTTEKQLSLNDMELQGILACLNYMKYFDE